VSAAVQRRGSIRNGAAWLRSRILETARMRTLAALALAAALAAPVVACAQAQPGTDAVFASTTVNLAAYGETQIAPDQAIINLGVSSRAVSRARPCG
jgi:uncharacterized protein YggE